MPRDHVAIVTRPIADALRSGAKRVETRLSRHRRTPWGQVRRGDRVHFKITGGPVIGTSRALDVQLLSGLTPTAVKHLGQRYHDAVCAPRAYWFARRRCRYAVLIWLGPLSPRCRTVSIPRQFGTGWVILPPR